MGSVWSQFVSHSVGRLGNFPYFCLFDCSFFFNYLFPFFFCTLTAEDLRICVGSKMLTATFELCTLHAPALTLVRSCIHTCTLCFARSCRCTPMHTLCILPVFVYLHFALHSIASFLLVIVSLYGIVFNLIYLDFPRFLPPCFFSDENVFFFHSNQQER